MLSNDKAGLSVTPGGSFEIGIRHSLIFEFFRAFFWVFDCSSSGGISGVFGFSRVIDRREFFHLDSNISRRFVASLSFISGHLFRSSDQYVNAIKAHNMLTLLIYTRLKFNKLMGVK